MARLDRYMLSQLMTLFGFFSLVLVLIYWINRAVILFDRLIADGQSAWVVLELTSLNLPGIMRIVLPLAAFVAVVYVTNRMSSESELTVVQATGFSAYRLVRPVLYFGAIQALLMSALTHFLVPMATEQLNQRQYEVSQNMTARLLVPGEFLSPTRGVTFYIREITPQGELLDILLSETTPDERRVTYTAARAYLVSTETGPQLVMVDGLAQTLNLESRRLTTTRFDDLSYDVSGLVGGRSAPRRSANGLSTWELFNPTPEVLEEVGRSAENLILRGHDRFAQATLAFVAGLVGFSALIIGGFSRFGLWRNIVFAVFLAVGLKALETTGMNIASRSPALWPFVYLAGIGGVLVSFALLHISQRPYFFKRRPLPMTRATT